MRRFTVHGRVRLVATGLAQSAKANILTVIKKRVQVNTADDFKAALAADKLGRAAACQPEIDF